MRKNTAKKVTGIFLRYRPTLKRGVAFARRIKKIERRARKRSNTDKKETKSKEDKNRSKKVRIENEYNQERERQKEDPYPPINMYIRQPTLHISDC